MRMQISKVRPTQNVTGITQVSQCFLNGNRGAIFVLLAVTTSLLNSTVGLAAQLTRWTFNPNTHQLELVVPGGTIPQYFLLAQPPRIVVDLPNTQMGNVLETATYSGTVRSVRVGQFQPELTRIVIELGPEAVFAPGHIAIQPLNPLPNDSATAAAEAWSIRPLLLGDSLGSVGSVDSRTPPPPDAIAPPTVAEIVDDETVADNASDNSFTENLPPLEPGATEIPIELLEQPIAPEISSPIVDEAIANSTENGEFDSNDDLFNSESLSSENNVTTDPDPVDESGDETIDETVARSIVDDQIIETHISSDDANEQSENNRSDVDETTALNDRSAAGLASETVRSGDVWSEQPDGNRSQAAIVTDSQENTEALEPQPRELEEPALAYLPRIEQAPPTPEDNVTDDFAIPVIDFGQPLQPDNAGITVLPPDSLPEGIAASEVGNDKLEDRESISEDVEDQYQGAVIVAVDEATLIPAGTVLTLRYPRDVVFSLSGTTTRQEVLVTATAVRDRAGAILVPSGSLMIGRFEPVGRDGLRFVAQALAVGDRTIPVDQTVTDLPNTRTIEPNQLIQIEVGDRIAR